MRTKLMPLAISNACVLAVGVAGAIVRKGLL